MQEVDASKLISEVKLGVNFGTVHSRPPFMDIYFGSKKNAIEPRFIDEDQRVTP